MYLKNRYPLVIFAICYLLGVAVALSMDSYNLKSFASHGIIGIITAIILYILYKNHNKLSEIFIICLLAVSLSFINTNNYLDNFYHPSINLSETSDSVILRIDKSLGKNSFNRYGYIISIIGSENLDKYQNIKARISTEHNLDVGDVAQCEMKFSIPRNSTYFNYERYLSSIGVFLTGSIKDDEINTNIDIYSDITILESFRQKVINNIFKYIPEQQAPIVISLTTADVSYNDPYLDNVLADSGLSHVISAFGSVIAIISGIIIYILRKVGIGIKPTYFIGIVVIMIFTLMVDFEPSIFRSSIMGIMYFTGKIIDRPANAITSLMFSALIAAIFNPFIIFSISFIFSYTSVLCIMYIVPFFIKISKEKFSLVYKNKVTSFFYRVYITSLVINIALIPINIYYFRRISVYASISNIFVAPLVPIIMCSGLLLILLYILPFGHYFYPIIGYIAKVATNLFVNIALFFADLPFASLYVWGNNIILAILVIVCIIIVLIIIYKFKNNLYYKIEKLSAFLCVIIFISGLYFDNTVEKDGVYLAAVNVSRSNSYTIFNKNDAVVILSKSYFNDSGAIISYLDNHGIDNISVLLIADEGKGTLSNASTLMEMVDIDNIIAPENCIVGEEIINFENSKIKFGENIIIEIQDNSFYVNMDNVSVNSFTDTTINEFAKYGIYIGESQRDFVPNVDYIIGGHKYNYSIQEYAGNKYDDVLIHHSIKQITQEAYNN